MDIIFSKQQQQQLEEHGISLERAQFQAQLFKNGFFYSQLSRSCRLQDGICLFSKEEKEQWIQKFETHRDKSLTHFIPASGAASRMFQPFFRLLKGLNKNPNDFQIQKEASQLLEQMHFFPFYPQILQKLGKTSNLNNILEFLLFPQGLNFREKPKVLIDFHSYLTGVRTPLEEHILEAIRISKENTKIHFTVASDHLKCIKEKLNQNQNHCHTYQCSLSTQSPKTDTLAQDDDGNWIVDSKQNLLLRPGGHGSLLYNLNKIQTELFFIKNIDNICHENHQDQAFFESKMILGFLIGLQKQMNDALVQEELITLSEQKKGIQQLEKLYSTYFTSSQTQSFSSFEKKRKFFCSFFNRPLRVCGMIKNRGDAGGGPFWIKDEDGIESIQIVEESQINLNDEEQRRILKSSTHFNPVFMAGILVDHHHKKFDLLKYQDEKSYLITKKNQAEQDFKILEWPGLWNGAMAKWNTILVEIDSKAFNPVKVVTDLIKKEHQP